MFYAFLSLRTMHRDPEKSNSNKTDEMKEEENVDIENMLSGSQFIQIYRVPSSRAFLDFL